MLIHEEINILGYLQEHPSCPFEQIHKKCLPSASLSVTERLLRNLEWLGYVSIFPGNDGRPFGVQITSRGMKMVANS